MKTASSFRTINNDIIADSKTKAKHSVKKIAKTDTTVAKTPDCFALSDTQTLLLIILQSANSSLKQTMIRSSRLAL